MLVLASSLCASFARAEEPRRLWLDVPFIAQEKDGCGAASIAMVIRYWQLKQQRVPDSSSDAIEIKKKLYVPESRGIYASAMEAYFRQHGFRAFSFRGELIDLKQHLEKGRPLIVALGDGSNAPLHYVVVVGLDSNQKLVLANDAAQRKLTKQDLSEFVEKWSATGNWTLLAVPSE